MSERNRNHRGPRKGKGKAKPKRPERQAASTARGPLRAGVGGPKEQTFWLYGSHAVLAALANSHRHCRRLLVTAEAWRRNRDNLETLLQSRPELSVENSERDQLDGLLPESSSHQGIALEVEPLSTISLGAFLSGRRHSTPEKVKTPDDEQADKKGEIVVVLDRIEDPRNLGAILRSAAAFRVDALILQDRHSPPESAAMAKAASGGLERVPMIRVPNLGRALEALQKAGYWCLGLDQGGEAPLSGFAPDQKTALVLGAEGQGLRRLTRQACDILCCLPTDPAFPVLNVSNAAAIALYELRRGSRGH